MVREPARPPPRRLSLKTAAKLLRPFASALTRHAHRLAACRDEEEPEEGVSSSWRPHWSAEHKRYYYKNMANKQDVKWDPDTTGW